MDSYLFTEAIEIPHHNNNIINVNKNDDDYVRECHDETTCNFKKIFYLVNVYAKKDRGLWTTLLNSYNTINFF